MKYRTEGTHNGEYFKIDFDCCLSHAENVRWCKDYVYNRFAGETVQVDVKKLEEEGRKFRKKPVVVEAFKFDGDFMSEGNYYVPEWMLKANYRFKEGELYILTLEGWMHVSVGDYVIRGIQGEVYPCKPDIFADTYEEVED